MTCASPRRVCFRRRRNSASRARTSFPTLSAGGNITSQQKPAARTDSLVRAYAGRSHRFRRLGPRLLGKVSPRDGSGARQAARQRVGAERGDRRRWSRTSPPLTSSFASTIWNWRSPIARSASRRDSLKLTQTLEQHGINSLLDVRQSEQLVYTAAPKFLTSSARSRSRRMPSAFCSASNPGDVPRGLKLTEQPHSPEVPAGIPSALLERRPDIREAETESGRRQRADRRRARSLLSRNRADSDARVMRVRR